MPGLNWDAFAELPGAATANFEWLCRAAVRHAYARYGRFAARAAQPGVEFHLRLDQDCPLGEAGRWFGWQCRWWDLRGGTAIGKTRRDKIEKAIRTTETQLPGLTDWVLWTRRPLTDDDQKWFYALSRPMKLTLSVSDDIDALLIGDAELLRATYFGDLVLTPHRLAELHTQSAASVGDRWIPEVHQTIDAERALRRMLGEQTPWDELTTVADSLARVADATAAATGGLPADLSAETAALADSGQRENERLVALHATLAVGDLETVQDMLADPLPPPPAACPPLLRRLRALRHQAALPTTNLIAAIRDTGPLLDNVHAHLATELAVIVAEAGCGKTQLAAQVTAPTETRPAGVLLHGRDLAARGSLDDLARTVTVGGRPVTGFHALLAAVDAAGQRAGVRLPVVIDGLNEAEDPRDWKPLLRSLLTTLPGYPHLLVTCTLRGELAGHVLPDGLPEPLEIPNFGADIDDAIARYFTYYLIVPGEAPLPRGLLRHPLSLRIYCDVANPERREQVGVERLPYSLTAMFDAYLDAAARRIGETSPRHNPYYPQDVRQALDTIGQALWEQGRRDFDQHELRTLLHDDGRPWTASLLRALEQDGVLTRRPADPGGSPKVSVIYDMLAGHLAAAALLNARGSRGIAEWLRDAATQTLLSGPPDGRHPLASDILVALAGLLPRRDGPQLWQVVDEPLVMPALRAAADLEAEHIDVRTVDRLASTIHALTGPRDIFDRLQETRGAPNHPLNATFLDRVLRPQDVADRDLRWSEWLRARSHGIIADLAWLQDQWRDDSERTGDDALRARWVMWTLTSTVRDLRDEATRALYWYGRGDPGGLFVLALDALAINDPYVADRAAAAAYGVAMAHQVPAPEFEEPLRAYLAGLRDALTGPDATAPTSHALMQHYAAGTVAFAARFYPAALPSGLTDPPTFAAGPSVQPLPEGDPRRAEADRTLGMDFHNYTIGRLFDDRDNYDMSHPGHQEATGHVLATVWDLGWRDGRFGELDRVIGQETLPPKASGRVERYGKKYGWVGLHTFAGLLDNRAALAAAPDSPHEVDIDPSFPDPPQPAPIDLPTWARVTPADKGRWLRHGTIATPGRLLCLPEFDGAPGPWVLVHGYLADDDAATRRNVFGFLTAVLIDSADADVLIDRLMTIPYPGRWLVPEPPDEYYVFAGEIPWHLRFAAPEPGHSITDSYTATVAGGARDVPVEIVAHSFAWEEYHSSVNRGAPAFVPSRPLSQAHDLRGLPQEFHQAAADGTLETLSFGAPHGFSGELLYVRQDLLEAYAKGRAIVLFAWGERRLRAAPPDRPTGAEARAYTEHANVWRMVKQHV